MSIVLLLLLFLFVGIGWFKLLYAARLQDLTAEFLWNHKNWSVVFADWKWHNLMRDTVWMNWVCKKKSVWIKIICKNKNRTRCLLVSHQRMGERMWNVHIFDTKSKPCAYVSTYNFCKSNSRRQFFSYISIGMPFNGSPNVLLCRLCVCVRVPS